MIYLVFHKDCSSVFLHPSFPLLFLIKFLVYCIYILIYILILNIISFFKFALSSFFDDGGEETASTEQEHHTVCVTFDYTPPLLSCCQIFWELYAKMLFHTSPPLISMP